MSLGVFFFVACFMTSVPFLYLCTRALRSSWDNKSDQVYEALRSPSVRNARNAFERRVALAIREAKQGYRTCSGCGFTNSMRVNACVICGDGFPEPKKGVGRFFAPNRPTTGDTLEVVVPQLSDRQRRVRRRKVWSRQLASDGRVVWRCQENELNRSGHSFPSFVLQEVVHPPTETVSVPTPVEPHAEVVAPRRSSTQEDTSTRTSQVTVEIVPTTPIPSITIEDVVTTLNTQLAATTTRLVDARLADPAHVPYTATSSPINGVRVAQAASAADQDFPTKLAQFITSTASLFDQSSQTNSHGEPTTTRLDVNRSDLMVESLEALARLTPDQARGPIRVEFLGERGVDAGGVYREWFMLLTEQIVMPTSGVFSCVDHQNQTFYLNRHSQYLLGEHHLAHMLAAGRIVGRALLEGNVTGFHLALPLLKIILGLPVDFTDLEYFDPETYKHLKWLLENDGVEDLCLDFTVVEKLPSGEIKLIELVPGGSSVDVTDANKIEFVERMFAYHLFESVSSQLFAFLKGLYEVVPAELLMVFDAEEFDYVLSGSDEIDVDDWEANTIISKNLMLQPAFFHFWKVVRELTSEERRRLLQFATGSTRVPPGGFSALTSQDGRLSLFSLKGVNPRTTWGCLHSHSCFNRLDVPLHRDLDSMREAVHAVISSDIVVGFTTA